MLVQIGAVAPIASVAKRPRPTIKRVLLALRAELVNKNSPVDRNTSIALVDRWLERHK